MTQSRTAASAAIPIGAAVIRASKGLRAAFVELGEDASVGVEAGGSVAAGALKEAKPPVTVK